MTLSKMAKFILAVGILNGIFLLSHASSDKPGDYYTFYHIANKRYLSAFGKSTTFKPQDSEKFEIFPAGNSVFLLTSPWLELGNPKRTLEITGGCNLNGEVRDYPFNRATNKMWVLNADGSISSACHPNWILVTDHYGIQTVKHIDSVPAANRVWKKELNRNIRKKYFQ